MINKILERIKEKTNFKLRKETETKTKINSKMFKLRTKMLLTINLIRTAILNMVVFASIDSSQNEVFKENNLTRMEVLVIILIVFAFILILLSLAIMIRIKELKRANDNIEKFIQTHGGF